MTFISPFQVLRQNAKLSMLKLIVSCQERNIVLPKMAQQLEDAIAAEDPEVRFQQFND